MPSFQESVAEYKRQLAIGTIKEAYRGLMEYMMALRTQMANMRPEYVISGSIYNGYMDMTYFSFTPEALTQRKLKIAIVLIHDTCRFEVWLSGYNRQVQEKYWKIIERRGWRKDRLVPDPKHSDAIVAEVLVDNPNFDDLSRLTAEIEKGTMRFINEAEGFLNSAS